MACRATLADRRACTAITAALLAVVASTPQPASADEGGVSFWHPGQFGSFAAAPLQPGWDVATTYYYGSASAGGNVEFARTLQIGQIPAKLTGTINGTLDSIASLGLITANYTFSTPLLGGQATAAVMGMYGNSRISMAGTLTGTLALPGGGSIPFTRSDSFSGSLTDFGDLYPQVNLRWNAGVHNFMTYVTGDVPVGAYDSSRLANIGIGHGAVDGGGGYTYLDPTTGHEFSVVSGFTFNSKNSETDYRSGVDWHLDWGASQFLSKQFSAGLVGYLYNQLSGDTAGKDYVGPFKSRVVGLGPQINWFFPLFRMQGYLNLKAYKEFDA